MKNSELIFDGVVNFEKGQIDFFQNLWDLCGCIELIEDLFKIEVSCGDGKFITDLEDFSEEMEKYDGEVCLKSPPRFLKNRKLLKGSYRFRLWNPEEGWSDRHLIGKITKYNE